MQSNVGESRFEVLGRLGRGGTAEVLRVAVGVPPRQAALKRPLTDQSPSTIDFQKLAAREALLIGGLRFPGLVRLLEHPGAEPEYLLLELCEGPTLDALGKIDDPKLALNILSAVALDLHFLHVKHVIHGDFKPHNVFVPAAWQQFGDGALRYAKLSDFSLGRFESEPESARAGLGTVGYMAPETIVEGISSHRSDLFAFGVTAYQLLTGHHPFICDESDPVRISANVRELTPEPIGKFRSDLSPLLTGLITSLLAKDPQNRPDTGLDVCRQLAEAGATYPYSRALAPKYVLDTTKSYEQDKRICAELTAKQSIWLDTITSADNSLLRLVLDANYWRGSLEVTDVGYQVTRDICWPSRLRRRALSDFAALSLADKRKAITDAAVLRELPYGPTALSHLLRPLLRLQTAKRLSQRYAPLAERNEQYQLATRLYLQAGDLERADQCVYQAAAKLRGEHRATEAVRCINSVIEVADMRGRLADVRASVMLKGDILKESGEVDGALETYRQIIHLYEALPPDKLLAETYKDLGDLYKMKQDSAAGLEALKQALDIFRRLGDDLEVSRTLNNIGNSHFYAGNLAQTLKHYRQALRIQRGLRTSADVASTLTNMGSVFLIKGRLTRGVILLEKSLEIKKDLGNIGEIARTLNNLGYALYMLGRYDEARSSLQESLELNRRIGSKKEILINLESLANLGLTAGFLKDSLNYLQEGLTLATELSDNPHQALFYHLLATAYLRMGRLAEAQQALSAASAVLPGIDDPQLPCNIEMTAGSIRLAIGDEAGAQQHWTEACRLAHSTDNKPLVLAAQLELARVAVDREIVASIKQTATELGMTRELHLVPFNCAEYLLDHGAASEALALLPEIGEILPRLKRDIDSARLHCIVGELLIGRQDLASARDLVAGGLQQAHMSGLVPEMARCLTLAAQIESRDGNFEGAFTKYRQALQLYKQIADTLTSDADRAFFQGKRSIRFLVEEIRRLGKLLEQKQRAG